ncbi:hypothetical protein V5N11_020676 [Cardamine amara subsp. amara]|uniref:Uncharacterized protein n=1 Tax=Cardamine amara subsp. amara TaxID=228776 RepID=A0ABD0ZD11_CARAN
MPPGAKKRKALKKKKQQEAIGTSINNNKGFNGDNLHGNNEHGSQDERGSDSTLSSPGSQGNEEFGTKDSSVALSSDVVKDSAKEISEDAGVTQGLGPKSGNGTAVERRTDEQKNTVEKSSENSTHTSKNVASHDACGGNSITEIAPVVDSVNHVVSVSKVVISEKSKHIESSTHSNLVEEKSDENEAYPSTGLGKSNGNVVTLPRSAAETSKIVESVRKSEIPASSEEKRLFLHDPQAVRTSWLSCCGLFDAMTGSDR